MRLLIRDVLVLSKIAAAFCVLAGHGSLLRAQSQPAQAVYAGRGGTDTFVSANPGAKLLSVDETGATYKTSKGYTLVTGPEVSAFDGVNWQVSKPQILPDASGGWIQTGAPAKVQITGNGATKHLRLTHDSSALDLVLNDVTYVSGQEFAFQASGATWRLHIVPRGHEFETTVKGRQGAKIWSFPYTRSGQVPTIGPKGELFVGSGISTSRAVMVGADKKSYPCGPWTVGSDALSFTCERPPTARRGPAVYDRPRHVLHWPDEHRVQRDRYRHNLLYRFWPTGVDILREI